MSTEMNPDHRDSREVDASDRPYSPPPKKEVSILIINPNTSISLTTELASVVDDLGYSEETQIGFYTAPEGPASINSEEDAGISADIVLRHLRQNKLIETHDAFLIACYSVHPLTTELRSILPRKVEIPVVGIFEASISTSLALLPPPTSNGDSRAFKKFGIITTGNYWEKKLTDGVLDFLGCEGRASCKRFKGVESTGFTAAELHTAPAQEVESRMMEATKRLVKDGDVSVICLGCAGMAGMDDVVRDACIYALGEDAGQQIHIIDGIKAGIAILDGLYRSKL